jgi:hypothetical protein
MMSQTFEQHQLQLGFTFRIVEMVKHIRIHPFPRAPWLPWGLSLATGTLLTLLGLISYPILLNPNVDLSSLEAPIEARVLDIGEIPVDVAKISDMPVMSNGDGNFDGRGVQLNAPTLRDALAFLFAPQVGEGKWTKKAGMPTARMALATSVVNEKVYAIGGAGPFDGGELSTVEEYDPATDKWTKKADMPTTRGWLSASVVNGKIYAIGGWMNRPLSTVEEYNPVTDKWTKKADMSTARGSLSTSVVNGKIYAIGGSHDGQVAFSTVEEYDPATDKWATRAGMPTARLLLSTSVVNEKVYAIGGWRPGSTFSTVEEYDPVTDKWTKKAHMPTVRYGLSTSAVNGKIYAIGGQQLRGDLLFRP